MMGKPEPAPAGGALRIMLLTTGLKLGGAERQVVSLAGELAGLGHRVIVVSLTDPCEVELPSSVERHSLGMRKTPLSLLGALWRARRLAAAWRPDVVHAHMVHANLFARLLSRLAPLPPLVCSAHSAQEGGRLRMALYRLTDRWCALTTHVSQEARQAMIEQGAVPAGRVVCVPNGIDTEMFRPDPELRRATRLALGLTDGDTLLLNVGRLAPEKDQALLLEAFAIARRKGLQARLAIAGDGPLLGTLSECIATRGLADTVQLLGRRADIPALMNAADLFVLSSRLEGMPLVIGEALACGTPVVATRVAGIEELGGPLVATAPVGDAAQLADAILAALAPAADGQATTGAERRERIVSRFSMAAVTRRWLQLYAGLLRADMVPARRSA